MPSPLCEHGRVECLTLQRVTGGLDLSLRIQSLDERRTHEIRFSNVRDLRFLGESTALSEIVLLLADDVSSDGWDGVRFRVTESENEFISFYCASIEGP